MTAVTPDNVWSLSVDTAARLEGPLRAAAGLRDPRVDETVALPRCSLYRKAFRGAAVGYPAEVLRWDAAARWIARRGVTVDVDCAEGLDIALSAGVDPVRIVMHRSDWTAGPVRRAVNAGVGCFVVSSSQQIALLDHCGCARSEC